MEGVKEIISRFESLKQKRGNFNSLWQTVSDLVMPRKSNISNKKSIGSRMDTLQYETTASNCADLLASFIHGNLTNPASDWFKLRFDGLSERVSSNKSLVDWLGASSKVVQTEINRPSAMFATNIHEIYLDLVVFGTACLWVGWNEKKDSLLFQSRPLSEIYVDENTNGSVDTVYRCFTMTLRNMISEFGEDALPSELRDIRDVKFKDKEYELLHAIFPNDNYNPDKLALANNRPFSSVYILKDKQHILKTSGYEEMPLIVIRWTKTTGEVYGRSPAIGCLADIKMIQSMSKEILIGAQMANRPPVMVSDDDQISPISTAPGATIRYRGTAPKAYDTGSRPQIGMDIMNEIRDRIRNAFHITQTMLVNGPTMTAEEVRTRAEEMMRLMGPVFGRMESELLGPLIERSFGLISRRGRLPKMPDMNMGETEEQEINMSVEYVSPLAMAQKQVDAQNMARAIEVSMPLLNLDGSAILNIDASKGVRDIFEMFGCAHILRSIDEVEEIKMSMQEKEQEDAENQQAMSALQLAGTAQEVQNAASTGQ